MIVLIDLHEEYVLDSLVEAKGLHSYSVSDDIRQIVIDQGFDQNKSRFKKIRNQEASSASKKFDSLFQETKSTLIKTTQSFLSKKTGRREWMEKVKEALKSSYFEAFDLGIKSSGISKFRAGTANMDRDWVQTAFVHEMRYFNNLLKDIQKGTYSGQLEKRLSAYAETLKHVFYAGKVMGTPTGMVIDWISPLDRNTCKGCRFLSEHSPYTKDVLPSTPRAGDTNCLNNCRCKLVARDVGKEKFEAVEKSHRSKEWYRRRLSSIKAGKLLSS